MAPPTSTAFWRMKASIAGTSKPWSTPCWRLSEHVIRRYMKRRPGSGTSAGTGASSSFAGGATNGDLTPVGSRTKESCSSTRGVFCSAIRHFLPELPQLSVSPQLLCSECCSSDSLSCLCYGQPIPKNARPPRGLSFWDIAYPRARPLPQP